MLRIALTGGIASGKTFVADELAGLGATIIDSDILAREVVEPGAPGLEEIRQRFGEAVLLNDGALDRTALAQIIFNDDHARSDLNAIVHPRVRALAEKREAAAHSDAVVVHVIPLLVEAGLADGFEHVLVVDVPTEVQLQRLQDRDGLDAEEAAARLRAQAGRDARLAVATWVINNAGTPTQTREQIRAWWQDHGV